MTSSVVSDVIKKRGDVISKQKQQNMTSSDGGDISEEIEDEGTKSISENLTKNSSISESIKSEINKKGDSYSSITESIQKNDDSISESIKSAIDDSMKSEEDSISEDSNLKQQQQRIMSATSSRRNSDR